MYSRPVNQRSQGEKISILITINIRNLKKREILDNVGTKKNVKSHGHVSSQIKEIGGYGHQIKGLRKRS